MASYTKQMMDLAKEWLEINTDPESPFLKIPRVTDTHPELTSPERHSAEAERIKKKVERTLAENPNHPNKSALLESGRRMIALANEIRDDHKKIRSEEDDLERMVNRLPDRGHHKSSADRVLNVNIGRWCLAWARHGYNTIELSPDFAAAMLLTDPRELDIASVRMPFRGILFLIPDGFAKGREGGHYTKVHITEMSRIDAVQLDAMGTMTDLLMDGTDFSGRQRIMAKVRSELAISEGVMAVSPLLAKASRNLFAKPKDEVKLLHIYATDGVRALETTIDRAGLTWDAFEQIANDVDSTDDVEAMRAVRQIVFGALAYATAIPTATTPVPNENPRGKRRGDEPAARRWEIGRTIKIDHRLVSSVRGGAREVLYRLKHRHIVRGHYRSQAHGVGWSERKTMWIAPFWRGPEDGAALVHTYKLDTDPGSSE